MRVLLYKFFSCFLSVFSVGRWGVVDIYPKVVPQASKVVIQSPKVVVCYPQVVVFSPEDKKLAESIK